MFLSIKLLALTSLICVLSNVHTAVLLNFVEEWKLEKDARMNFEAELANNNSDFLYSTCFSRPSNVLHCNITLEMLPSENDPDPIKQTCEIEFEATKGFEMICEKVWLKRLGEDKVIVSSLGEIQRCLMDPTLPPYDFCGNIKNSNSLKVITLNMSNCNSSLSSFKFDNSSNRFFTNIVAYENSFDVIIDSKKACGKVNQCKISFDEEGKQIDEPHPFLINVSKAEIRPLSRTSADKGLFSLGYTKNNEVKAMYIGDDNELLFYNVPTNSRRTKEFFSHTYDMFGFCQTNYTHIIGAQFNVLGERTMHFELERKSLNRHVFAIHNLDGGGMLLLSLICHGTSQSRFWYCDEQVDLFATKIEANGEQGKMAELLSLNFKCYINYYFDGISSSLVEKDDEICIHFACGHNEYFNKSELNYSTQCIPKSRLE